MYSHEFQQNSIFSTVVCHVDELFPYATFDETDSNVNWRNTIFRQKIDQASIYW